MHHRVLESIELLLYEASNTEEPCAGKLHAGSVRGRSGDWPFYLDGLKSYIVLLRYAGNERKFSQSAPAILLLKD